jgi:hypothetical protein
MKLNKANLFLFLFALAYLCSIAPSWAQGRFPCHDLLSNKMDERFSLWPAPRQKAESWEKINFYDVLYRREILPSVVWKKR